MSKELNSQFKANSFCCTLNNIDKLFDVNDTSFNDEKYSDETRKQVEEFRNNLEADKKYSLASMRQGKYATYAKNLQEKWRNTVAGSSSSFLR